MNGMESKQIQSPRLVHEIAEQGTIVSDLTMRVRAVAATLHALANDLHGTVPHGDPDAEQGPSSNGRLSAMRTSLEIHANAVTDLEEQLRRLCMIERTADAHGF